MQKLVARPEANQDLAVHRVDWRGPRNFRISLRGFEWQKIDSRAARSHRCRNTCLSAQAHLGRAVWAIRVCSDSPAEYLLSLFTHGPRLAQ
jgi:hypothetical protein